MGQAICLTNLHFILRLRSRTVCSEFLLFLKAYQATFQFLERDARIPAFQPVRGDARLCASEKLLAPMACEDYQLESGDNAGPFFLPIIFDIRYFCFIHDLVSTLLRPAPRTSKMVDEVKENRHGHRDDYNNVEPANREFFTVGALDFPQSQDDPTVMAVPDHLNLDLRLFNGPSETS